MKKLKKKCFSVVISDDLYDFVQEMAETMYLSDDAFIQKIVEENIKMGMSKTFGTSLDFDDFIDQPNEKKSTIHYCNKPENEDCPFMNSFSYDDVDF